MTARCGWSCAADRAAACIDEILYRLALRLGHPGDGLCRGKIIRIFEIGFIVEIGVRPQVAAWPDHPVAKHQEKLIGLQKRRRQRAIVHCVIYGDAKLPENLVEADADIVGIVIAVAHQRERARPDLRDRGRTGKTGGHAADHGAA